MKVVWQFGGFALVSLGFSFGIGVPLVGHWSEGSFLHITL
jgi:hypothetical protein